jgi:hypothetical protein
VCSSQPIFGICTKSGCQPTYGPHTPDGLPLPEILTSDAVIVALKTAVGDGSNAKQLDIGIVEDGAHLDRVIGDIGIKRRVLKQLGTLTTMGESRGLRWKSKSDPYQK